MDRTVTNRVTLVKKNIAGETTQLSTSALTPDGPQ
jgi:hypothetical protein